MTLTSTPLRHAKLYASAESARDSRAGLRPGTEVAECKPCQGWHVQAAPKPPRVRDASAKVRAGRAEIKGSPKGTGGSASGKVTAPLPGEFRPKVKLLVRTRAGNGEPEEARCESCGIWLGKDAGECQHIVARGMGGCRLAVINGPANAAFLCPACHRIAETRDAEMGARGFWLPQGTDPRDVPMMLAGEHGSGVLVWRGEDGGYLFEGPAEAGAA
jgi:hypothetical protein